MAKRKSQDFIQSTETPPQEMQQEVIREFYRKMLMLQEEEKRRISRDLHDETGQIVVALGASLNIIEKELKEGRVENVLRLLNENRKLVQEIAGKMKSMAFTLRPPALDILGLAAVLREYFSLCTNTSPLKIEFNHDIKDIKLNENTEITLYRIIQEAIYNVMKHSKAKKVKVDLLFSDKKLQLEIADDGVGFSVEEYHSHYNGTKMGLRGIKERVDILNGTFSIESAPQKGTTLKISLPLEY